MIALLEKNFVMLFILIILINIQLLKKLHIYLEFKTESSEPFTHFENVGLKKFTLKKITVFPTNQKRCHNELLWAEFDARVSAHFAYFTVFVVPSFQTSREFPPSSPTTLTTHNRRDDGADFGEWRPGLKHIHVKKKTHTHTHSHKHAVTNVVFYGKNVVRLTIRNRFGAVVVRIWSRKHR